MIRISPTESRWVWNDELDLISCLIRFKLICRIFAPNDPESDSICWSLFRGVIVSMRNFFYTKMNDRERPYAEWWLFLIARLILISVFAYACTTIKHICRSHYTKAIFTLTAFAVFYQCTQHCDGRFSYIASFTLSKLGHTCCFYHMWQYRSSILASIWHLIAVLLYTFIDSYRKRNRTDKIFSNFLSYFYHLSSLQHLLEFFI